MTSFGRGESDTTVSANDPSMTIPQTNRLLHQVAAQLDAQQDALAHLGTLAELEHQARLAAESTARWWRWATVGLGLLTLGAAMVGVAVAL